MANFCLSLMNTYDFENSKTTIFLKDMIILPLDIFLILLSHSIGSLLGSLNVIHILKANECSFLVVPFEIHNYRLVKSKARKKLKIVLCRAKYAAYGN